MLNGTSILHAAHAEGSTLQALSRLRAAILHAPNFADYSSRVNLQWLESVPSSMHDN